MLVEAARLDRAVAEEKLGASRRYLFESSGAIW
jgi:hypothetical protein